jgi:hypothetical protein
MRGFTDDVKVLLGATDPERLKRTRKIFGDCKTVDEAASLIRDGILCSLHEFLHDRPGFVKQIVGRALVECVDWNEIAQWATVNPECN